MKTLKIIAHPLSLDRLLSILTAHGIDEILTTEVRQFGGPSRGGTFRGNTYPIRAAIKVVLEFAASEFAAHAVIEAILVAEKGRAGESFRIMVGSAEEVSSVADLDRSFAHA